MGLRSRNKEINVERQRRREESVREMVAEQVRKKDDKIDAINKERQRLWNLRRFQQSEAYRAREQVKNEIMRQRIKSKFDSKTLEQRLNKLMAQDVFSEKILNHSSSMPTILRPPAGGCGPDASMEA